MKEQTRGILYKVINLLTYSVITVCNKSVLKYTGTSVAQLFFASALAGFVCISFFLKFARNESLLALTKKINVGYIFRIILNIGGRYTFLYSMLVIDATAATAIGYLRPIFALLLGVFFLSEKITWRIGSALLISIIGAAVVTGPLVVEKVSIFHILAAFLAPLFWAIYDLIVKKQCEKDSWEQQVFLVFLLISICSFPMALADWKPLTLKMIGAFFMIGLMYVIIEMSLAKALKRITLVLVAPITFIRIIFTAILGYLFVEERVNAATLIGCALIIIATIFVLGTVSSEKVKLEVGDMRDEDPS